MRFHCGLALLFLILGGLECSWTTSARAAEHLHLNKGAWVHRRGILDPIVGVIDADPSSSSPSSTSSVAPSSDPGITSAVPPTSVGSDPPTLTSSSPGLLGFLLGDSTTTTPPPPPASSHPSPTTTPGNAGLLPDLAGLLHGPSSSTSTDPTPSTSSDRDHGLLPLLPTPTPDPSSSDAGLFPPLLTPSSSQPDAIPTPTPDPSSSDAGLLPPPLTPILNPSSSDSAPSPSPSSSDPGIILPPLLTPSSSQPDPIPTPIPTPNPSSSDSGGILPILTPILVPSSSSDSGGGQTSAIPPTSVLPLPLPGTSSDAPPPPSDSPVVSFAPPSSPLLPLPATSSDALPPPPPSPSPSLSSVPPTPAPLLPSTTPPTSPPSSPPSPPPARPTPSSSISVNSDLSFILTESSLAVASLPTSANPALAGTLTDPDAATTTITNTQPSAFPSPSSPFVSGSPTDPSRGDSSQPLLPSGIPSRIYPASRQVDPGVTQSDMEKEGYTLISLLFDQQLNWPFVVNSPIASSQIFAFTTPVIATAIDEPGDRVKTLFLQVFVPVTYDSPEDQTDLSTLWLGYIPTVKVDTLEAMIKAKQSKFYKGVSNQAAQQLAARVRSGWGIKGTVGVGDDTSSSGGGGSSSSETASQKARRDAIVGVVSSLGAIAVLVLVVLIVHSVKRKRELAHRRLADRASSLGSSGEDIPGAAVSGGREFDRDSVGAPRRRSFYFAEDSLRGWEAERADQDRELGATSPSSGGGMSQRKIGPVVVPGSISAPILRESSMNW